MRPRYFYQAIFLISVAGIAYQVILMRIFSIAQWHHFAYMVISIAMLGFAAGGTFISLIRKSIEGREVVYLRRASFSLTISLVICYALSQQIPFETHQLVSQPIQWLYLFALYVLLAIPFFLTSCCILISFFIRKNNVGKVYAVNMIGSGLGALFVVFLMFAMKPASIPYVLTLVATVATLLLFADGPYPEIQSVLLISALICFWIVIGFHPIRVSEYKGLSYILRLPDSKILAQSQSPLSVLQAVESKQIRETPGQVSHRYPWKKYGELPKQIGLYFDAGSVSAIHQVESDPKELAFLDYVTGALPYQLIEKPETLIIGAGGGTDVLSALAHDAPMVTALEVDPRVFTVMKRHFQEFSGRIWDREDVKTVQVEGRSFLNSNKKRYNLIQIALLDSFNASSAGVYALNESYLYTREAIELYIHRLGREGILSITRWIKTPARDAIKMFATIVEAAERAGYDHPENHLAFIRSWNTATIVFSRPVLKPQDIEVIRRFAKEREFDLVYVPGIKKNEVNRYTILEKPVYYEAVQSILSEGRKRFYREYLFHIKPAVDNQPYFFRFFKWASLNRLIRGMGSEWIPFVEWGYLTLLATIVQGFIASVFLVLLPLLVFAGSAWAGIRSKRSIFSFFTLIGLAYMFLEIAFIQKFMFFLAYPIYAVSVVLTSFLFFSGFGSFFADRYRGDRHQLISVVVALIGIISLLYFTILPFLFQSWSGWSDQAKIVMSIILLAPIAFCMGIPFPIGFQIITSRFELCASWAWGINGCASVLGASIATLFAIHMGFSMVVFAAWLFYVLAGLSLFRLNRPQET